MTIYFLDSSALLKRYVPEIGTHWIRSITQPIAGNTILISQMTSIEVISGITRRRREGRITSHVARSTRIVVDRHTARDYSVVSLNNALIQQAEDLLEMHPLRAYDAVQLASALESHHRIIQTGSSPLIFVSADQRLLTAATAEGLQVDDPNLHP